MVVDVRELVPQCFGNICYAQVPCHGIEVFCKVKFFLGYAKGFEIPLFQG